MASNILTDKTLYESVTCSGSTAYSTGFDLVNSERAQNGKVQLQIDVSTYTSGTFQIALIGDSAQPLDSGSAVKYTLPDITAAGIYAMPLPQDFGQRWVGIKIGGTSPTGVVEVRAFELDN